MVLLGCADASAAGCDRHAARSGSDTAAGTQSAPFKTAQRLVESLRAGETGCLGAGTYDEQESGPYVLDMERGGTSGAPITVRSVPGQRATLTGIVTVGPKATNVVLSHLDFVGTGVQNTIKIYASDVVLEDNDITNRRRGESCIILGSNSRRGHGALRTVIRRNVLKDCGSPENGNRDHGIYAANASDGEIVDNVFARPAAYAIQLYPNAQRMRVARNVIDGRGSVRGGVVFGGDDDHASSGNVVEQNVIANAATYGVTTSWGDAGRGKDNIARGNCIAGAREDLLGEIIGFRAERNVEGEVPFLDAAAGDYRLRAGSRCLQIVGQDTAAIIRKRRGSQPAASRARPAVRRARKSCATRAQRRRLSSRQRARCARRGRTRVRTA